MPRMADTAYSDDVHSGPKIKNEFDLNNIKIAARVGAELAQISSRSSIQEHPTVFRKS